MRNNGKITNGSAEGKYLKFKVPVKGSINRVTLKVHRVVAASFLGRNDNLVVNHKDGNTKNNKPENLEYVTQQENAIHAYNTGLNKHVRKVYQFDMQGNFVKDFYPC